ncbi:MAG: MATE family efflux transporter, partial [Endomicrobiales bacterium]|nr:MATE family efflux transporter [Endomicrobiales bacterium]
MLKKLKNFFCSGHYRSANVKRNIFWIFVLRGISIVIGLVMVPMTLHYLGPGKYGIWLTLGSIISWLSFFDIGLGGGLRNKLAESLTGNDNEQARYYVSTAYAILISIMAAVFLVFFVINRFINWGIILGAPAGTSDELSRLALWMVVFFCIKFIFGLMVSILKADQRSAMSSSLDTVSSILSLVAVYILIKTTSGSLFFLGFWRSFCVAIVPVAASMLFFTKRYRCIVPSLRYVDFAYARDIMELGVKFFIIQISAIVIFSTDNIIISQLLGPEKVTPYVIVYKYFYIITMVFATISIPLWSAYTQAYVKEDFRWIKNTLRKILSLLIPASVIVLFMILFARPIIIGIWIGEDVGFDVPLIILMGIYVLVQIWNRTYSWVLNGIGRLNYTLYTMVAGAIINIPLSIFFVKTVGMGISGVILGTIISLSIFAVFGPIYVY